MRMSRDKNERGEISNIGVRVGFLHPRPWGEGIIDGIEGIWDSGKGAGMGMGIRWDGWM